VREGQLAVTGNAYDPDGGDVVSYQLLLLDPNSPSGAPLYNVTPGPLNSQRFHLGAVTNASLGTLDLSVVQNGAYLLKLVVRGGGDIASASLPIAVNSNLKIGQFDFACTDCHGQAANKWIRGQWLGEPKGQFDHFPLWRTSRNEIWDIRKRFQWCQVAIWADDLPPDAKEYGDLELYLASLNQGQTLSVPGIRH